MIILLLLRKKSREIVILMLYIKKFDYRVAIDKELAIIIIFIRSIPVKYISSLVSNLLQGRMLRLKYTFKISVINSIC